MTEFENVLAECLRDLEQGASSVDECLSRYPQHALQLRPVLLTTEYLQQGRAARPSAAFKARVRSRLLQGMEARPRRSMPFGFLWVRPAMGLAAVLLALLATGTAYAQNALPGDAFYTWKRASENAWRAVSPDPVGTDLALAGRRVEELIAVRDHPVLHTEVLKAYFEVVARLESEMNAEDAARILQVLESQMETLSNAGIPIPQFDPGALPPVDEPAPASTATPVFLTEIPSVEPTDIPELVPTVITEIPQIKPTTLPEVVPTVPTPPKLIPTIEIPPLIR
ncbi:MAG TPA: hypothetical protein VI524_02565 [Anaerolineales bacterium]|nr:hypothetical protein [Anaerolineales bacterium]